MNTIFTNERTNSKRQVELDIAKGLAIIFMVWVHVNEYYQGTAFYGSVYNRVVEFLGSPPAAPIFTILLGVGIVYSRKSGPRQLMIRGVKLLSGGYALSFLRDFIPYLILYNSSQDKELLTEASYLLWGADILQFAGLAFLFFAVVIKYQLSNKVLFVLWCIFSSLNILLRGITFPSHFANAFWGLFWGTYDYSWFPFLNWITFPIIGYVFGQYLIRCKDKTKLYKQILLLSSMLSVPLWIYSYVNNIQFGAFGELWQQAYYHHDIIGSMVLTTFAFFWISLCYFAVPFIPEVMKKALIRWSRNSTCMYSISYIILGFSILVLVTEHYHPVIVCLLAVIIYILSDLTCILYEKIKKK